MDLAIAFVGPKRIYKEKANAVAFIEPEALMVGEGRIMTTVASESRCAKCNAGMEEGILLDFGHGDRTRALSWIAGPVEASFWRGLKIAGKPRFEVRALRCSSCGYLECYAK
jgi:hypothetical protein